jgi:hypothetical protein
MDYSQRYCELANHMSIKLARSAAWAMTCRAKGLPLTTQQQADINEAEQILWAKA